MPLSQPVARREVHHRLIDMQAYAREDGLYDVEAHLVDTKPFEFVRVSSPRPVPAGEALHDLWIRMTVDGDYTVRAIEAASDITPYGICKEAESTLSVLVGERLVRGWSAKVKERLRGAASCTHLMELLMPMATTAYQTLGMGISVPGGIGVVDGILVLALTAAGASAAAALAAVLLYRLLSNGSVLAAGWAAIAARSTRLRSLSVAR